MASDVYSIGVVFYQVMMMQEKLEDIDFDQIPQEFSLLLQQMLDPDPQNRPSVSLLLTYRLMQ
jgi:serine/threonine protein kinase